MKIYLQALPGTISKTVEIAIARGQEVEKNDRHQRKHIRPLFAFDHIDKMVIKL